MQRRKFIQSGAAVIASAAFPASSPWAQDAYPSRPVTFIVGYVPGGSADQRARQIGRHMSETLRQPVIIENRPGASGNIGASLIARSRPDGYVLGMGNLGPLAVNPHMYRKMTFNPQTDLTPIALIEKGPLLLVVRPESPYRTVTQLLEESQRKAGGLTFGSSGSGSAHHLAGELLKTLTDAKMVHVPYKGGAAAMIDLLGGQIDFMFEPMYSAMPSLKAGKLRPLAITSLSRSPVAGDIPTMEEAGVKGFHIENWQGLIGPADMPVPLVRKLNQSVNGALADPVIRQQMLAQGNEIGGGTAEQFGAFIKAESARWKKIVTDNRIVVE